MTLVGPVQVTISVGVAEVNLNDPSPEDALARADLALYQAKAQGRNQVAVSTATHPAVRVQS